MKKLISENIYITTLYRLVIIIFLASIISCKGQNNNKQVQVNRPVKPELTRRSFRTKTPVFEQYHSNLDGIVSEFVRKMYQDTSGNIWFGTNGDYTVGYNGTSMQWFTADQGAYGSAIRGIAEDKYGNIWFGTSSGLNKYDGKSFTNFSEKHGLLNNEI